MEKTKKIKIERTKSGYPALWENGGSKTNTGECTIIADANGRPKKPVYIKRAGHLANAQHALIIVQSGDFVIYVYHKRKDYWIRIYRISNISNIEEFATAELVYEFSDGQWNHTLPAYLQPAVTAGMEKATCYHCRSAHYIAE